MRSVQPNSLHFPRIETASESPNQPGKSGGNRKSEGKKASSQPSETVRLAPVRNVMEAFRNSRHQSRVIQDLIFGRNSSFGERGRDGGLQDTDSRHGALLAARSAALQLIENLDVLIQHEESAQ